MSSLRQKHFILVQPPVPQKIPAPYNVYRVHLPKLSDLSSVDLQRRSTSLVNMSIHLSTRNGSGSSRPHWSKPRLVLRRNTSRPLRAAKSLSARNRLHLVPSPRKKKTWRPRNVSERKNNKLLKLNVLPKNNVSVIGAALRLKRHVYRLKKRSVR